MSVRRLLAVALAAAAAAGPGAAQKGFRGPVPIGKIELAPPADPKSAVPDIVRIELVVDGSGVPLSVKAEDGLPDGAVEAIAAARFTPAANDGRPVASMVSMPILVYRSVGDMVEHARRSWLRSKEVSDAFAAAGSLDQAGAAALKQRLATHPDEERPRLELIAYSTIAPSPETAALRLDQLLWFAQRDPSNDLFAAPYGIPASPSSGPAFENLRTIWISQLNRRGSERGIFDHATNFLRFTDPELVERAALANLHQSGPPAVILGDLYGIAALGITAVDPASGEASAAGRRLPDSAFAVRARARLLENLDPRLRLAALETITRAGPSLAAHGRLPDGYLDYCRQVLASVKTALPSVKLDCSTDPHDAAGGSIIMPRVKKKKDPRFPSEARDRGISGTTTFSLIVDENGLPADIELKSGPLALYSAARTAISRWTFYPATRDGVPVSNFASIDVNFSLQRR